MPGFTYPITDVPTIVAVGVIGFICLVAGFALLALWIDDVYAREHRKPEPVYDDEQLGAVMTALAMPYFAAHGADRASALRRTR